MSLSCRQYVNDEIREPETTQKVISMNNSISDENTIARLIASKSDFSESVVLALIDELVAQIAGEVRMGHKVSLSGLGTFSSKNVSVKQDADDDTNLICEDKKVKSIRFKPSQEMIEELNLDVNSVTLKQVVVSKADRFQNILQAVDMSGILMLKHIGIFNKCSLSTTYQDICELVELKFIKMIGNYAVIRA